MEVKDLRLLQLLEEISTESSISQRDLSETLNISLGLVNTFVKHLVKKGYCKVRTIPMNRVKYILTPSGALEKTRLTYEYIFSSYQYLKDAKNRLQTLFSGFEKEGTERIVFYGAQELAEVAYLSLQGMGLELVGIVDPEKAGRHFNSLIVAPAENLKHLDYDILLITTLNDHDKVLKDIQKIGVPKEKIRFFQ